MSEQRRKKMRHEKPELEAAKGIKLGCFHNKWRGRIVEIYAHTTNPAKVITVGRCPNGDRIVCEENFDDYKATLQRIEAALPEIYVYE